MAFHDHLFATTGEMGVRIREHDWRRSGLGDMADWSPTLWTALGICLRSRLPIALFWGEELRLLYNDAWLDIAGARHPAGLGKPARHVWHDLWHLIGPQLDEVRGQRTGLAAQDAPLPRDDGDAVRRSWWDYSLTPVIGPDGHVAGVLSHARDTTRRVDARRRDAQVAELDVAIREAPTTAATLDAALPMIGDALAASRTGLWEIDAARGLVHIERNWTDGTVAAITGTRPLAALGPAMRAILAAGEPYLLDDATADPRLDAAQRADHAAQDIRARIVVPIVEEGRPVGALFAHDRRPRRGSPHHAAYAAAAAERLWQRIARVRAETALRDGDERYRLIFEQTDAILFSTDRDGRITACNPAAARAFGRPAVELVLRPLAELIDADGYRALSAAMADAPDGGETAAADVTVVRDGRPRRLEATASPAIDRDGATTGLHGVARDVTERRQDEERQQRLINELNHRVKNTLALVQGLALQSFRDARPLADERAAFQQRLAALAAVHDLLTRRHWAAVPLAALAAHAMREAGAEDRMTAAGPSVMLDAKLAVSLALALNELTVNARAHGALGVPRGHVSLGWEAQDGRLRLAWREAGGPRVATPPCLGFGLRMAQRTLASDFRGKVRLDFGEAGFGLALDAPLPVAADAAAAA